MCLADCNKQKYFFAILKATEEMSRVRIRDPVVRIRGSRSIYKNITDPEYRRVFAKKGRSYILKNSYEQGSATYFGTNSQH
jgi:hypothetical protein